MSLLNALNWRYAVKHFSDIKLSAQQIDFLTESIRLAPSAFGLQPYRLIVVESTDLKNKLMPACFNQPQIISCSHLFIFAGQTRIEQSDIAEFIKKLAKTQQTTVEKLTGYQQQIEQSLLPLSQNAKQQMAAEQCYIALGTLLAAAAIEKIDTCPMTGFDAMQVNTILGLNTQGLSAAVLCPLGIRSNEDKTALRKKHRISQSEFVVNL